MVIELDYLEYRGAITLERVKKQPIKRTYRTLAFEYEEVVSMVAI